MRSINEAGHFFFHWRNALFPALLLAIVLMFPPTAYTDVAATTLLVAGLIALAIGQGLRVATIGLDYIRRGGKDGRIYADRLVTGGIFAHCRNPMYTGNVLIVFGFVLIAGNPFAIVVGGLLFAFMYGAIVHSEETFLLSTFGDAYRDYCREVPRWTVRPAGLSRTLARHRFDWAAVVIREYGTLFTNGLVALALLSWKAERADDLAVVGPICLALAALLAIAYAAARYMKKTHGDLFVIERPQPEFLPFSRPALGADEIAAVTEVLRSGWITTGPKNEELEASFCRQLGSCYAVALSSATAGMHITLMALGIGSGDEVITPSQTWVSTANMICLLGATPVFVDIDRHTLMADAAAIEAAITVRTKAIIPVHYAGAPVDLDAMRALARRHGIALVEDAAHAAGACYRQQQVGAAGTAIFSFHAIKNMTSAEGGMLVTDDEALAQRVRSLKFHGLGVDAYDRQTAGRSPQAEVIEPGYKYNLADINAAIAMVQLHRLPELNARRAELAAAYQGKLARLPLHPLQAPSYPHRHAWHLFMLRVDAKECGIDRDALMHELKARNIGSGIHFRAVHTQKYYRRRFPDIHLPNTEWNSERLMTLPLFPDMSLTDVDRVVSALEEILEQAHA